MSSFERLHPALQHHIVNSFGWRELRSFQEAVIPRILAGEHLIVLAPTAGGKTEAAFFPTVSRMLFEGWTGLSILYICPIKALLNNLDVRLQRYCSLLGRRSALWHGDVKRSNRKSILREPPDCLLTTPESLEVMLVSPNVDARELLKDLRVVIVDEIHAFAGDDRGWHLLAVLERISRLADREIQRIGLSATVGNAEELADWLAGSRGGHRGVFVPSEGQRDDAEVKLDFVGSIENAAIVVSRLHRGQKRLVFVDSRARAERLGAELRGLNVTTFVTHSSLSQDQRRQAEEAFASRNDCVIVATSVLELGIDVGDLDRVIQIDSPSTVSSFLQRMGRTGRRSGTVRNCLFLATNDEALVQAAALLELFSEGYVEPIVPPKEPYHILAQQLMALALQERGIGRRDWLGWISNVPAFSLMPRKRVECLVDWMLSQDILWDEEGILWLGQAGETAYGRRNFLELLSVFMSPPLFSVLHGRHDLGFVDEMTFLGKHEGPRTLLLGGRAWQVAHIDWQRRIAYVEPTELIGRSRWKGEAPRLGFQLCQAIKRVLADDEQRESWSHRATEKVNDLRQDYAWLDSESTAVVSGPNGAPRWWTFAGSGANAVLASGLAQFTRSQTEHDSFAVSFDFHSTGNEVERAVVQLQAHGIGEARPAIEEPAIQGLKFSRCLPVDVATNILQSRLCDYKGARAAMEQTLRVVLIADT